jgi:hypothetical protein
MLVLALVAAGVWVSVKKEAPLMLDAKHSGKIGK